MMHRVIVVDRDNGGTHERMKRKSASPMVVKLTHQDSSDLC